MMERMPPDPSFAPTQLAARAAYLLRGNDLGTMTTAAPLLYPHMWSWDAAFVAVGLAPLSVERAVVELDTLLSAQWTNGMIPHIVFANGVDGYFPGPARWACSALAANAPRTRHTSGITQPPVHAIAVQRILDHARTRGRSTRAVAEEFLDRRWADLVRWHRWLADARDQNGTAGSRCTTAGSPAWTTRRAGIARTPTWFPAMCRSISARTTPSSTDPSQRPSDGEYDRYLWLLEEMKAARYDDELLAKAMSFAVEDVFVTAVFSMACDVLATIGEDYKRPNSDVRDLYAWAERFRQASSRPPTNDRARQGISICAPTVDPHRDPRDVRAAAVRRAAARRGRALLRIFEGPKFCGHPDLRYALSRRRRRCRATSGRASTGAARCGR